MTKANDDLSLKLFVVLSRAHSAVMTEVEKDIRSYGLNPTEFAVIELLYHKGDQPLQKIGEKILISSGSITYVVDKLEKKQLLLRRPCPKDRRITYATLTDEGKQWMDERFHVHKERIAHILSGLNKDETEEAIQLLKKLGLHASS
ncbi:MarR family transcriptional regulator [Alkalihalophilus pseudofirmus OF4]|jgi:MarR family 2-MHQ and catechol resistance regulon transcriptional repressor|uniref:MarR family transcriptional regulator n=2 Tax=Alkalihalophilus TaxID=2893060 RepID=D3FXC1_ALKPO|nr:MULTISPECIES: MarR family transcriptional regulator [Alkalihalophilus]ADC50632.1 MarR family transcriptional regulator [Alkalihalophilus pseudofirmus OF4]ERN54612.1 MarR family transcriptional regulator [Alkalihalophilus marmarensis DSM 21297]MCM3488850.1 MarR family transcriptional regulator [Alkalihalophilus marmarensis]